MSKTKIAGIVTIGLLIVGIFAIGIGRANGATLQSVGTGTNGTKLGLLGGHNLGTPADGSYVGTGFDSTDNGSQTAAYGGNVFGTGGDGPSGFVTLGGTFLGQRGGVNNQGGYTVGMRFGSGGCGMHFNGGDHGMDFGGGGFFAGTRGAGFGQGTGRVGFGTAHHTGAGSFGA